METKLYSNNLKIPETKEVKKNTETKSIETTEKEPNIPIKKDDKAIDSKSVKPVKSTPYNFINENQDKTLTKQRLEGAVAKGAVHAIGKISTEVATKTIAKVETKVATEAVGKIATKTAAAGIEKALLKSLWVNGSQTVVMSVGEEVTLKAMEKVAANAAKKGSQEASKKIAGAVPFVGAVIEAGFTLYDAKYAYELSKDKNATFVSKALAWGTVGLDAVSMVCTATGVGTPIAWAATGLSVVTSVASDMLKYKNKK